MGSAATITPGTSVIDITAGGSSKTFGGGGKTYNTVRYASAGSTALAITGNNTFRNLDLEDTTARTITLPAGGSQLVTGTLTLQGASGQVLSLVSSAPGTKTRITAKRMVRTFDSPSADVELIGVPSSMPLVGVG